MRFVEIIRAIKQSKILINPFVLNVGIAEIPVDWWMIKILCENTKATEYV